MPKITFCITYFTNYLLLDYYKLVSLPTHFFVDLTYTTDRKLILCSNLNYKKLLKCVNTTNSLHTNLKYKNIYKSADTPTIFISDLNGNATEICQ